MSPGAKRICQLDWTFFAWNYGRFPANHYLWIQNKFILTWIASLSSKLFWTKKFWVPKVRSEFWSPKIYQNAMTKIKHNIWPKRFLECFWHKRWFGAWKCFVMKNNFWRKIFSSLSFCGHKIYLWSKIIWIKNKSKLSKLSGPIKFSFLA